LFDACCAQAGTTLFFLGPRGTGKTSWCTHEHPDALRVDLLNPAVLRRYSRTAEYLIELVEANAKAKQVVIDETQKLPALLEVVHLPTERKTGAQFILTGSSAHKLRCQGVNLLGPCHPEAHGPLHGRPQVSRKTVEGYLDIVEDLLLGYRIEGPPGK
jgi:hypothetical protein